jgi:hypothetical protein
MPHIFFGHETRSRGASKLAVEMSRGTLEPTEPSKFKIFGRPKVVIPSFSLISGILGHLVTVLSFPKFSYMMFLDEGEFVQPPENPLPFFRCNLAVPIMKDKTVQEGAAASLDARGFTSMKYSNRSVWLKEFASKEDYMWVRESVGVSDDTGAAPSRYLNPASFSAYLSLISLTTRICEAFHHLTKEGSTPKVGTLQRGRSKAVDGWKLVSDYTSDGDMPTGTEDGTFAFKKPEVFSLTTDPDKVLNQVVLRPGSAVGNSYSDSAALYNTLDHHMPGFIKSGDTKSITSHGLIFKFNERLAMPDPNSIGDVIGRHFMSALGSSFEEQFESLNTLKSGISGLRLTRLGDELAHLYKCIDVAIMCQAGCVPFFNGNVYEGCVVMGGPGGVIGYNDKDHVEFLGPDDLKDEFLLVSDHASAINLISLKFPVDERAMVTEVTSMAQLWKLCITLKCSADDRDYIVQKAADLEFGVKPWVISPANLKACFKIMCNPVGEIRAEVPISRLCLFSSDTIMIALSCFGEKSCPSWDIPNGVSNSLRRPTPPSPPAEVPKGAGKSGQVSDAGWIMVVRSTDLFSAVDDFRRMAKDVRFRSTSSVVAKKVGHRVFSRDRMMEFWGDMQDAYRHVNPEAKFEGSEVESKKRPASDGSGPLGDNDQKKKRKMGF